MGRPAAAADEAGRRPACGRAGTVTLPVIRDGVVLAIGTAKGAFVLTGGQLSAPLFPGEHVPALAIDTRRATPRLLAGTVSRRAAGVRWCAAATTRAAPGPIRRCGRCGSPRRGRHARPGLAARAVDARGARHRLRRGGARCAVPLRGPGGRLDPGGRLVGPRGPPGLDAGFGGLGVHTVLVDPRDSDRLRVAISTGGVYRSVDGGRPGAANHGIRAADSSPTRPRPSASASTRSPRTPPTSGACTPRTTTASTAPTTAGTWVDRSDDLRATSGSPSVALPADRRHRLCGAARVGRVPLDAGGSLPRLSHRRRRRLVGGFGGGAPPPLTPT